jgi:membrane protease YdiL (CAAX protease family)
LPMSFSDLAELTAFDLPSPGAAWDRARLRRTVGVSYIAAVIVSEAVTAFVDPAVGLTIYAVLLLLLFGCAVLAGPRAGQTASADALADPLMVFPTLALVPLARILSLTMPVPSLPGIYWYAVTAAPLLLAALLTTRLLGARWTRETIRIGWSRAQSVITVSALPLSLLTYLALRPARLQPHLSLTSFLTGALVLAFAAMTEEVVFRGILQPVFADLLGGTGIAASAILFAAMYLGTGSGPYIVVIALVGLLFGWWVRVTKSVSGVIATHAIISIGLVLIWPYLLG